VVEPGEREKKRQKGFAIFRSVVDRAKTNVELVLDSAATGMVMRSRYTGLGKGRAETKAGVTGVMKGSGITITHTGEFKKVVEVHAVPNTAAELSNW